MSDMKCPFCQQKLQETYDGKQFWCSNYKDPTHPINMLGTKELWQALIDTKKKLDVAVDALKVYSSESGNWWYGYEFQGKYEDNAGEYADKALEQITALEQKDTK